MYVDKLFSQIIVQGKQCEFYKVEFYFIPEHSEIKALANKKLTLFHKFEISDYENICHQKKCEFHYT